MDRWVGKVAIVTGASSGIGEASVEKLVDAGLKVSNNKVMWWISVSADIRGRKRSVSVRYFSVDLEWNFYITTFR